MYLFGFNSVAELNTYVTFVLLGISIMTVMSAITSAPSFISEYYKYATGDPLAVCEKPYFWTNSLTFFNAGTYFMQFWCEFFSLTHFVRRIPLRLRILVGLVIPFIEMLLIVIIPAIKISSQDGAITLLMVVSVMGGFSKALSDSTTGALVGPFPTKFMSGEQWGLTVSALLMSIVQILLKGTMKTDFYSVLTQSRIYFGIGIFLQLITLIEIIILPKNPFAQKYIAEFGVKRKDVMMQQGSELIGNLHRTPDRVNDTLFGLENTREQPCNDERIVNGLQTAADGRILMNDQPHDTEEARRMQLELKQVDLYDGNNGSGTHAVEPFHGEDHNRHHSGPRMTVLTATGDADKMADIDQTGKMTSSEQMLRSSVLSVIQKVWPMLLCIFFIFGLSLLLFPGYFINVYPDDGWYSTIIVLFFNIGDFMARTILMFPFLQPSPKTVLYGTFFRMFIIPLLVLCRHHYIIGKALPYVLVWALGITNGYFGSMGCIHCPRTPSLSKAGERSLAAICGCISTMLGLCVGSNFALLLNLKDSGK